MADILREAFSGFFNSVNNDRLYNAEDMNRPYKRLVGEGVFATPYGTPSNDLQTYSNGLMSVRVKLGDGIFGGKWFSLQADEVYSVEPNTSQNSRIDSIIVRVDNRLESRKSYIVYRTGAASATPVAPALSDNPAIIEYRLANINVPPNATASNGTIIDDIVDKRGTSDGTPWVTGLIQQVDTSTLLDSYETAYNGWLTRARQNFRSWEADERTNFDEWFNDIKEELSTSTLIRSYNNRYVTSENDEIIIPIGVPQYNQNIDILQVYISGLLLAKDVEYTVIDNNSIMLTDGVAQNTSIYFVVYKSIDGSQAETVVSQVTQLQSRLEILKATSETGSTKVNVMSGASVLSTFFNTGKGLHTIYVQSGAIDTPTSGAFRGIGQVTGEDAGYILLIQANGSMFSNYMNAGQWRGWRAIYEVEPTPLYKSDAGVFPNNGVTITPIKPLSACAHGWQLIFTAYDDAANTARDLYTQVVSIPKKSYKGGNWSGESTAFNLLSAVDSSGNITQCAKVFTVYNDRLESGTTNSAGASRGMVLRAIYEY